MSRKIFRNVNLLDGENPAQPGVTVVIENGRVASVGEAVEAVSGDREVDLTGLTLMPGMCSGHYHAVYHNLGGDGEMAMNADPLQQAYRAQSNAELALRWGYTAVVGAGTHHDIDANLAQSIDSGVVKGPRFIPGSRSFLPSLEENDNEIARMCKGPEQFRQGALRDIERGAKVMKIFASGGHGARTPRNVTTEELEAFVQVAHENGARVRAHVVGKEMMLECARIGVDIIDHADGLDDECMKVFVEKNLFVLPSLYLPLRATQLEGNAFGFDDLEDFNYMCEVLPKAVEAGVKIVPGDDYGTWQIPHGSYSEELACYVEHSDVSALEVIKWATKYGGELTGIPDLGMIAPGMLADMVVVNGDPSRDIRVLTKLENIVAVLKDGEVVSGQLPQRQAASMESSPVLVA